MSSDDVEIIDVDDDDDVWTPATPPPPPPPRRANVDVEYGGGLARTTRGTAASSATLHPLSSSAAAAACGDAGAGLRALPPLRAQADAQTDLESRDDASAARAAALHARLQAMEAALGICAPAYAPAVPSSSSVPAAIRGVAAAWREAAASWKRDRTEQETAVDPVKHVKRETSAQAPACMREDDATPAWAAGLATALDQVGDLLASSSASSTANLAALPSKHLSLSRSTIPSVQAAGLRAGQREAHNATPHCAPTPVPRPSHRRAEPEAAAMAESPTNISDAETALLREAQLVCAREHQTSLLPLYTELNALRRQRGEREQHAAETVAKQLEWEQRRLSDMLTECDAQLDMLEENFEDACRRRLAPLDALQQRMEALQAFRRKLDAHAADLVPLAARTAGEAAPKAADGDAGVLARRPAGLVGEVLSRYLEEERRGWERATAAVQTRLDEQTRRNAELQACYVQANAQLQASLDRDNYVNKDVIAALKAQQQTDVAALVRQLGWLLVNSTTDVLSLRHPVTGATLHTNHAYSTINGQACEDVSTALAAYLVKHGKATGAAPPSLTSVPPPAAPVQPAQPEVLANVEHAAAEGQEEAAELSRAEAEGSDTTSIEHTAHSEASQPPSSISQTGSATEEDAEGDDAGEGDGVATASTTYAPAAAADAAAGFETAASAEEVRTAEATLSSVASGGGDEDSTATAEDEEASDQDAEPVKEHDECVDEQVNSAAEGGEGDESSGEASSPRTGNDDDGDDEEAAEETLVGYSNAPTEEESTLTSSRVGDSGAAVSASPHEQERATTAASTPYDSFFASQLWDNDTE